MKKFSEFVNEKKINIKDEEAVERYFDSVIDQNYPDTELSSKQAAKVYGLIQKDIDAGKIKTEGDILNAIFDYVQ